MRLLLLHPDVAARSCGDCVRWLHNDSGTKFGKVTTRGGKPVERPRGTKPPCRICPKIPEGADPTPENAVELKGADRQAYIHYRECRAVNAFPDDPLVRRDAAVFRAVEDAAERLASQRLSLAVISEAMRGGG